MVGSPTTVDPQQHPTPRGAHVRASVLTSEAAHRAQRLLEERAAQVRVPGHLLPTPPPL